MDYRQSTPGEENMEELIIGLYETLGPQFWVKPLTAADPPCLMNVLIIMCLMMTHDQLYMLNVLLIQVSENPSLNSERFEKMCSSLMMVISTSFNLKIDKVCTEEDLFHLLNGTFSTMDSSIINASLLAGIMKDDEWEELYEHLSVIVVEE